jgi:DNA-binding NarL/FixJ family response regulator
MRKLMNQVAIQTPAPPPSAPDLTERELEVLRLVAEGLSNREIASGLVISEKTVKTHISSLLGKLGLEDRTRLAIYAIRHGLAKEG